MPLAASTNALLKSTGWEGSRIRGSKRQAWQHPDVMCDRCAQHGYDCEVERPKYDAVTAEFALTRCWRCRDETNGNGACECAFKALGNPRYAVVTESSGRKVLQRRTQHATRSSRRQQNLPCEHVPDRSPSPRRFATRSARPVASAAHKAPKQTPAIKVTKRKRPSRLGKRQRLPLTDEDSGSDAATCSENESDIDDQPKSRRPRLNMLEESHEEEDDGMGEYFDMNAALGEDSGMGNGLGDIRLDGAGVSPPREPIDDPQAFDVEGDADGGDVQGELEEEAGNELGAHDIPEGFVDGDAGDAVGEDQGLEATTDTTVNPTAQNVKSSTPPPRMREFGEGAQGVKIVGPRGFMVLSTPLFPELHLPPSNGSDIAATASPDLSTPATRDTRLTAPAVSSSKTSIADTTLGRTLEPRHKTDQVSASTNSGSADDAGSSPAMEDSSGEDMGRSTDPGIGQAAGLPGASGKDIDGQSDEEVEIGRAEHEGDQGLFNPGLLSPWTPRPSDLEADLGITDCSPYTPHLTPSPIDTPLSRRRTSLTRLSSVDDGQEGEGYLDQSVIESDDDQTSDPSSADQSAPVTRPQDSCATLDMQVDIDAVRALRYAAINAIADRARGENGADVLDSHRELMRRADQFLAAWGSGH